MKTFQPSTILKKNVGLIHSSNKLTLVQRKLANALLYNAYNNLLTQSEHQIGLAELCGLIGYNSKDFMLIRKALVALISTVLEWNLLDKDNADNEEGVWNASALIADASIDGAICTYSYSNKMRQLLHHPKLYGKLNMRVQMQFKSTYGLALYENCIRYQNIKQTTWVRLALFRKLMGVDEGQYQVFRDFKRRVLDKAIEEVNTYAPIFVVPETKKQGRQVVAIRFLIKPNNQETALVLQKGGEEEEISVVLTKQYGLSGKQAADVMKNYTKAFIKEKIQIIQLSNSFQQGKIRNLAQYLLKALDEDYQSPTPAKAKANNHQSKKCEYLETGQKREEMIGDYKRYQYKWVIARYAKLGSDNQAQIRNEFTKKMKGNVLENVYLKEGLKNIIVSDRFCSFIIQRHKDLLSDCMSFDKFFEFSQRNRNDNDD